MDWITVSSKIDRLTYAELKHYCENEKITPSQFIKNLIEAHVSTLIPLNKAGVNKFDYDKRNDCYTWTIEFDDGEKVQVAEKLSPSFIQDVAEQIQRELATRKSYLKKTKKESVTTPTQIKKIVGVKKNAKR